MATTTAPAASALTPARTPLRAWLAVVSVMMGAFLISTTEIMPIGLLTPIGSSFHVSEGMAGLMMTIVGLLAAISAPTLTIATARLDRRLMLGANIVLLALADFVAATAPTYWVMLLSRVLVGITVGGFWSISGGLAARLVRPESVGRAAVVIFSAVPLGSVLGVPAGTLLGDLAGWRITFAAMGVVTVGVLAALIVLVPALPVARATATRLRVLREILRGGSARAGLLLIFLVVLAHFGTYTFVRPFLQQVTHVSPSSITVFLLVYGVAGIAGNFLLGPKAARYPRATFATIAAMIAVATLLMPVLGRSDLGALALLILWGAAYGTTPVASQTWLVKSAPHAPEAAAVLFTASFQATLSIGALAGGVVVDQASAPTDMVLGGIIALLAVLTAWIHFARRVPWTSEPQH